MRLHVDVGGAEERRRTFDGKPLYNVDMLAAPVEAVAGIPFKRLVADLVAQRFAHGAAHDVFRGDELDLGVLAARFVVERLADLRVGVGE